MNKQFWDKATLYKEIDKLMNNLGITINHRNYPLNSKLLAERFCYNLDLKNLNFGTSSICGVLQKGSKGTSIALNCNRNAEMQNFDCMHELVHYFFHGSEHTSHISYENGTIKQHSWSEWQANEGAAQALVPYQILIPQYVIYSRYYAHDTEMINRTNAVFAKFFSVTEAVIQNRISTLKFPIWHYMTGMPIEDVPIISYKKIKDYGLDRYEPIYQYCKHCLGIIRSGDKFCSICGTSLEWDWQDTSNHTSEGVGYIVYAPSPHNVLGNWCTNLKCNAKLDTNMRYCPFCRSESYLYRNRFLQDWFDEYNIATQYWDTATKAV